jgi:hypothetical protein
LELDESVRNDGDYDRYLVLATPQEAEKLLSAFGGNAVLIKLTGFKGIDEECRADEG